LGTGDLSELALGWATYGVGDHMSHYNVNASVPKTLIQHLLRWVIDSRQFEEETGAILQSILDTEISPELVPAEDNENNGEPAQSTQAKIGPYELQDFNTYYTTRYGFRPSKIAFLAHHAGAIKRAAIIPKACRPKSATSTHWQKSRSGWASSCGVSSKSANSSVRVFRTARKSVAAARSVRAVIGAHPSDSKRRMD
jgi:NH3-dependent NAD+ synthetase